MSECVTSRLWLALRTLAGEGVKFGEQGRGLGCTDPLEYLQCLPQQDLGLGGVAVGHGAAAQAGQRVSLIPEDGDSSGQFQSLQVTSFSLREFTPDPEQRPPFIERCGLAGPTAEVAVDVQGLLQSLGRAWVIFCLSPRGPEVEEGVRLAEPVTEVAVDFQGLLQSLGRARVITHPSLHVPKVVEGVRLAEPVTEV